MTRGPARPARGSSLPTSLASTGPHGRTARIVRAGATRRRDRRSRARGEKRVPQHLKPCRLRGFRNRAPGGEQPEGGGRPRRGIRRATPRLLDPVAVAPNCELLALARLVAKVRAGRGEGRRSRPGTRIGGRRRIKSKFSLSACADAMIRDALGDAFRKRRGIETEAGARAIFGTG
jgi:hypothetical protein